MKVLIDSMNGYPGSYLGEVKRVDPNASYFDKKTDNSRCRILAEVDTLKEFLALINSLDEYLTIVGRGFYNSVKDNEKDIDFFIEIQSGD